MDLSRLNKSQKQAVTTIDGALLLLAGAGTGKTTVITYRIAHMIEQGITPQSILALTFTNKAANEMKERVISLVGRERGLLVTMGTFHSFCLSILKKYISYIGYDLSFSLADEQLQTRILKQVMVELQIGDSSGINLPQIKAYITTQKQQLLFYDQVDETLLEGIEYTLFTCWRKYQILLKDQNLLDFDDLIVLSIRLFWDNAEILQLHQKYYKYLMVDEYQDTNLAQLELLRLLAGEMQNVCAVGDDDQSIYGWRGANLSNILEFEQDFRDCKIIRIEENYRCSGNIITAANEVIANNSARYVKTLRANAVQGEQIKVVACCNELEEAETISSHIREFHHNKHVAYDKFAVLFRSNSQSRLLEMAFRAKRIPYKIVGATSFYSRAEIQDAIAYLKILANPKDDNSLLRVLNTPSRGIGEASIEKLWELRRSSNRPMTELVGDEKFYSKLSSTAANNCREFHRVYTQFQRIIVQENGALMPNCRQYLNEIGYLPGLMKIYSKRAEAEMRLNNIHEFLNDVINFMEKEKRGTLRDYLLRFILSNDDDKLEGEGVTMLTVHSSKGLEFDYVYLVGLEDELFPHMQSVGEGNLEEERRLFYVAITRTKKELLISWAKNRKVYGKDKKRRLSQFVKELPENVVNHNDSKTLFGPPTAADIEKSFADFFADI